MRTPSPSYCGLDLIPPLADRFIFGVAPIDYGPVLLLMPFGSHLTVDTLPSGESELPPASEAVNPAFGYDAPHPSVRGTSTLLNNALLSAHYKPLRHPMPPGPSLAGLRLVIADHVMGLPVLRALSLVYMPSPIPRRSDWVPRLLTSPAVSAFPDSDSGSAHASSFSRLARRSLPLRPAHSHRHRIS